jgi:hypothetical protein
VLAQLVVGGGVGVESVRRRRVDDLDAVERDLELRGSVADPEEEKGREEKREERSAGDRSGLLDQRVEEELFSGCGAPRAGADDAGVDALAPGCARL